MDTPLISQSDRERFEAKIERLPWSGCWVWLGSIVPEGYGLFRLGKTRTVHRVAWEIYRGPIPSNLCVLHRCDVRSCVNPDHLFLGTNLDNVRDMIAKGRAYFESDRRRLWTHCIRGHAFTLENTHITRTGKRSCRKCKAESWMRGYWRRHGEKDSTSRP